ncbi:hypothetical protein TEQG_08086 [Trichophyton equinum CBS 127.97]|uniref:Uncharacterized protein n=1 Tax=Trichophyton equinum (strain ATCC MYA-4606 / CBS 127.97) TaxID=559882 RepID=F2Q4J0_TRIEC|nr:hypothetical protein TEQG_08086 [Trichophyton equinum CBS 127.97]
MAGRPEGNAGSEGDRIEIGRLSQELKKHIDARQEWLISTKEFEQANPLENEVVLNHTEFKELIQKLAHKSMAQILLFRMEDDSPKRIHGKRVLISYLYPLRIPTKSKVLSAYPETPNSTSEELHVGMFVKYQDEIYIDGALDFLLIRVAEPVKK